MKNIYSKAKATSLSDNWTILKPAIKKYIDVLKKAKKVVSKAKLDKSSKKSKKNEKKTLTKLKNAFAEIYHKIVGENSGKKSKKKKK